MDVEEILAQLDQAHTQLPRTLLADAAAHRVEIIPRLLAVLEEAAKDPALFAEDKSRSIHIYATYLLAEFREPRAYPLLVKIFSVPGEIPFDLAGTVVTEDLGSILASVSDGDPGGMLELVENESVNEYVRAAALDGFVALMALGKRTRDDVMTYCRRLFQILERKPSELWNGLANVCADLCPLEVAAEIRQAFDEGLVDPGSIGLGDVEEALETGPTAAWEVAIGRYQLIENTADAIRWWGCFHKHDEKGKWVQANTDAEDGLENLEEDGDSLFSDIRTEHDFPQPYRRTEPKVGRNEPCPCGSGKKYKKCCGLITGANPPA
jgi:hypothetical protein